MFKNIFITGGSGVLGTSVIEKLSDFKLYCLVHSTTIRKENINIIKGDIRLPQLGLKDNDYKKLCGKIDLVVHMAAMTGFNMSYEKVSTTNVDGTINVLQLAKDAQVPLYHVSTAYVHNFNKEDSYITKGNGYEVSKTEAEKYLRDSPVPVTIIKPSIILGDSKSGKIVNQQGFHFIAKLLLENRLPIIPGDTDAKIDIVSQDYVADIISLLIRRKNIGGEFFITLGENSPKLEEVVTSIVHSGFQITGQPFIMPKIVSGEVFDRLIKPVFLPKLPFNYRREIKLALYMFKYINIKGYLPSSVDLLKESIGIKEHPDIKKVIYNNVKYMIESELIEATL